MCVSESRFRITLGEEIPETFEVGRVLKQGDAILSLLFNIVLEEVIREAQIDIKLFAENGPEIILAYTYNLDVIRNTLIKVKDIFQRVNS